MEKKKNVSVNTENKTEQTPSEPKSEKKGNSLAELMLKEIYSLKKSVESLRENNRMLSQLIEISESETTPAKVPNDALIKKLIKENNSYKRLAVERIKDMVFNKVKAAFPDIKYATFEEFPSDFHRLVCAQVSPEIAYRVVAENSEVKKPAEMGKINENSEQERDFYTSKEVDKLTKKQLSNPKVMETVLKSMLKW